MPCTQCGAPLSADDPFCPKCGARQTAGLPAPADPQRAALERAIGNQYDIVRLLGRGGMGAVYLAREKALERAVAIKVLPPETAADADTRERFRREARTAAKLTHPNIVPLHTFGEVEGMLYFVMGYVKGESLAERMRREGKLPAEDVRRILAEVADALHYAHKQGVVHRDIKPDNILLEDETGRPMLTDFGVAKAKASGTTLTEAGAVVGTPYYMSPEQASGAREIDGRSDLYSLGVMGYQMLSGRVPFEGEDFRDVIVQHVTQEPAPLSAVAPEAPPDLVEAVMRCLAKEPGGRWPDGRALRVGIEFEPAEDDELLRGYRRSLNRAFAGAAALGLVGLLAVCAWAAFPVLRRIYLGKLILAALIGGPLFIVGAIRGARREGLSRHEITSLFFKPPRWWPYWWPAAWRARGDVWDRLPPAIRGARHKGLLTWVLGLTLVLTILAGGALGERGLQGWGSTVFYAVVLGELVAIPALAASANEGLTRWRRSHGIDPVDGELLGFRATGDVAFWRHPKFAALLLPPAGRTVGVAGPEPQSPTELAHAIRELVGQLPSDTRVTVSEAGEAAQQVAEVIASLDAELANLARDADPQELEVIESKLRALGPESADEGEVRRQKRALLVNQRDLLRHLDQRLASVNDRRARLVDMLRTMWLQLANLRAEAAHDTLAVTEISGRVKALCGEIDAQVQAAETVRMVAE